MKIITLNTWGNSGPYQDRWNLFLEELERYHPDVLCLQEVFELTLPEKIKKKFSFQNVSASYEAGLVIMTRFPKFSEQVLSYESISPSEQQNRQAILVGLKIKSKEIIIANTHLAWKTEDEPVRYRQVQELLQTIPIKGYPVLLAGDFNDTIGSKPVEEIKKAGYVDLCSISHPGERKITWDNQNPFIRTHSVKFPDRQIDFLFLHKQLLRTITVKTCKIAFNRPNQNGIYPSDHYGVFAEIKF